MDYNKHLGVANLVAGPVDWVSWINDFLSKIVKSTPTIEITVGETIAAYKVFFISSDGQAYICDGLENPHGVWGDASTGSGNDGFGQISGLSINDSWSWNEGVFLYPDSSGVLTETPGRSRPVAFTVSPTEIIILPPVFADPAMDGLMKKDTVRATYNFSVHGGTQGAIGLGSFLPDNAVVIRAYYYVVTTLTSSTDAATISIDIPTDDPAGILAAIEIIHSTNPWDAGHHECIQDGAATNFSEKVSNTGGREISITIGTEDLTAGKFTVFCDYVIIE
jgi:hypothetical protein